VPENYAPEYVTLELTLACNLRCVHCGSSAGKPRPQELSRSEWRDVFRRLAALGGEEVCFLGGEPLLRADWEELVGDARDCALDVVLITNGLLLDEPTCARAARAGVDRVAVSVDGTAEVHDAIRGRGGAFEAARSALLRLLDAGLETGVITSVFRANFTALPALRDELVAPYDLSWQIQVATTGGDRFDADLMLSPEQFHKLGAFIQETRRNHPTLAVAGAHDIGYHSTVLADYGEQPQEAWRGCGAGVFTLGIASDGGVRGCLSLPDSWTVANLRERPLEDIWRDDGLFERNRRFRPEQLQGFCTGCPHSVTCRAGCAASALATTSSPFENRYCFFRIETENAAHSAARDGS